MPGLLRGVARTAVVAGTASTVAGRVGHRQQKKWAAQDQEAAADQGQPDDSAPAASGITDEEIDQLDKLGELKDKGILTQDEFDQKKKQILGL